MRLVAGRSGARESICSGSSDQQDTLHHSRPPPSDQLHGLVGDPERRLAVSRGLMRPGEVGHQVALFGQDAAGVRLPQAVFECGDRLRQACRRDAGDPETQPRTRRDVAGDGLIRQFEDLAGEHDPVPRLTREERVEV